jgi:hypothetical protein
MKMSKRSSSATGYIYDPAQDLAFAEVEIATTMNILGMAPNVDTTTIDEIIAASRAMHMYIPMDERAHWSDEKRRYRPAADEFMVIESRQLDEHVRRAWYWRNAAKGFQAL